jgi:hypothetical protein
MIRGEQTYLRLDLLTPKDVTHEAGMLPGRGADGEAFDFFTIRFTAHQSFWRNATALSWAAREDDAKIVTLDQDGAHWHFETDKQTLTFDWDTQLVVVQP